MRTILPEMSVCRDSDFSIHHRDTAVKRKMKQHADIRTHAKPCKIQIGDRKKTHCKIQIGYWYDKINTTSCLHLLSQISRLGPERKAP